MYSYNGIVNSFYKSLFEHLKNRYKCIWEEVANVLSETNWLDFLITPKMKQKQHFSSSNKV